MTEWTPNFAESLRRYIRALRKRDGLGPFFDVLNESGEAYLFGGAPRDVAFGARKDVHDLDIFVSGVIDLERVARFSAVRKNRFGGLRLYVARMDVDAWELQKSYTFIYGMSPHVSILNLLRSVCFSTDGIAVSLKSGRLINTIEFSNSVSLRNLDFVVRPRKLDSVVAARIARLSLKLDLLPSRSVARYFLDCLAETGVEKLISIESRWGRHRILNDILVEQIRSKFSEPIHEPIEDR
jgi:hypothetical protein